MRIAVFDAKPHDRLFLGTSSFTAPDWEWHFIEARLTQETAGLAQGTPVVCVFVHDDVSRAVIQSLVAGGTRLLALRCAGYNNVDLQAAKELGLHVARVPAYSPHAVAEHAVGLMLSLNRKFHRAYSRVRDGNFALEGLLGFDMAERTIGVIGTGKIGECVVRILQGFGAKVLAFDVVTNPDVTALGVEYVPLSDLFRLSDIITLHCPLLPSTQHLVNDSSLDEMKQGVMIVNTSRGGLVDTSAVIKGLKAGKIGYLGLDVYEEEDSLFFEDRSLEILQDDLFARLLTFPNVLVTAHQGFFTREALQGIARTTFENISRFENSSPNNNRLA